MQMKKTGWLPWSPVEAKLVKRVPDIGELYYALHGIECIEFLKADSNVKTLFDCYVTFSRKKRSVKAFTW